MTIPSFAIANYDPMLKDDDGYPKPPPDNQFWVSEQCPNDFELYRGRRIDNHDGTDSYLGYPSYTFLWKYLRTDIAVEIRNIYKDVVFNPAKANQRQAFWFYAFNKESLIWTPKCGVMLQPEQTVADKPSFVNFRVKFSRLNLHVNKKTTTLTYRSFYYGKGRFADNAWDWI